METLCTSFWFWFVTSGLVLISVVASFYTGLFIGVELGRRQIQIENQKAIRIMSDRYGLSERG